MEGLDANRPRFGGDQLEPPSSGQHYPPRPVTEVIPERPTSAGGASRRVAARSLGFEPSSSYRSRDCIEFVLSIPNEPRIPGQVKNRAALLKIMNSPDFDHEAYYHFQNGQLLEKSNSQILSDDAEQSLVSREGGGPVYTWAPMSFGPANANIATTVQPDSPGHHRVIQRFQVIGLKPFLDLECLYDTGASHPFIFDDDFRRLGLHANTHRLGIQLKSVEIQTASGNINRQAVFCDASHMDNQGNVISGPRAEFVVWDHTKSSSQETRLSWLMPQQTAWAISRPGATSMAFGLRKQETLSAEIRASGGRA